MYKLYSIIAVISVLIRQFILPNPLEPLGDVFDVTLYSITFPLTPDIANWIAEPILHLLAFGVTGIYYSRGSDEPAIGSFLYLLFYAVHTGILLLMSKAQFECWAVIGLIVLYILGHIGIKILLNTGRRY